MEAAKTATLKRCYFDWADQLKMNPAGNVPYTPVLPLLYGMKESLALINGEGIDNVIARHNRRARDAVCWPLLWDLCEKLRPYWNVSLLTTCTHEL